MAWEPETYYLKRNQHAPNNAYPVLVYRQCLPLPVSEEKTKLFLESHAWERKGTWGHIGVRHFHPNVHECYGVIAGESTMLVGCGIDDADGSGQEIELMVGDVIVLPAGTGHCNLQSTKDYLYVGVYPAEVDNVPLPEEDPVTGKDGPLMKLWVRPNSTEAV
ncbi:hypothetical protein SBRCBS47491_010085 [Sporothrix bragantina]|uniref:Cupin type-1 domain-containing protein n=1 Tax=Sporothrix bragantina TaxID=671064 RepID=A0ABP0D359_9PEZI